jgi:hypothetical protein
MALAGAGPSTTERGRQHVVAGAIREVATWLGDTPTVARSSYVDPRLIEIYQRDGGLAAVPVLPAALPAPAEAEAAVAALLASDKSDESGTRHPGRPAGPGERT